MKTAVIWIIALGGSLVLLYVALRLLVGKSDPAEPRSERSLQADGSVRYKVSRTAYASKPYLAWNACVQLAAMEEPDALKLPTQRALHLAFWYDSEVNNGGHGQYFENRDRDGRSGIPGATVDALKAVGAPVHAALHADANARRRVAPDEEWIEFDKRFGTAPVLVDILQKYAADHYDDFIEWTD